MKIIDLPSYLKTLWVSWRKPGTRFLEVRTRYTKTDIRQYARQKGVSRKQAALSVRQTVEKGNAILLADAAKHLVTHHTEKDGEDLVLVSRLPIVDEKETDDTTILP